MKFSGKVRQSVKIYLNKNLGLRIFFANGFVETFRSKTNVVSISKVNFPVFCKFFSDEVETIFWES